MSYSVDEVKIMEARVADEIMKIPGVVKIEVGKFYESLPVQYRGPCVMISIKQSDEKSQQDLADRIFEIMNVHKIPWDTRMIVVVNE